ncbi:MAG: hypothetical protein IJT02_06620 [Synergistaceae bacterium]|nr:hypothetical protein [Synergistaceae bacterium]
MMDNLGTMRPTPNAQRPTPDSAQNQDEVIHVVLAVYDPSGTYSQHAGVVMTSIFENTQSKVTVHLLHDNTLTEENRQKFIRTAEKYSQGLEFHDVTEYFSQVSDDVKRSTKQFTVGTLFRLLIPHTIKLDKVIYLDTDLVVNMDIRELWNVDIGQNCIAGYHDKLLYERLQDRVIGWLNGGDSRNEINAGVLPMNLAMIRKKGDMFRDAMKWFSRRYHLATRADQSFIYVYFGNSITMLDERMNLRNPPASRSVDDCIIHTAGGVKTWEMSGFPVNKLYWHHYLRSAWGENSSCEELLEAISSRIKQPQPKPCLIKRIARRLFNTTPAVIVRILLKDIYYRLKHALSRH